MNEMFNSSPPTPIADQPTGPWSDLPAGRYLVVGAGATGLSVVRFLVAAGFDVAVTDTRKEPPALTAIADQFPNVAVFVGGLDEAAFAHADAIVISPGVPANAGPIAAAAARGLPIFGDIELFARALNHCPLKPVVVAITGSNGKSTVTALVAELLKTIGLETQIGGNFGIPALDLLDDVGRCQCEAVVLELSSFQIETLYSLRAHAATVLNISADHMDRYRDIDEYADVKARLLKMTDRAVLNADDPMVVEMAAALESPTWFSLSDPAAKYHLGTNGDLVAEQTVLAAADDMGLRGNHNAANALAAVALTRDALAVWEPDVPRQLTPEMVNSALQRFVGLPHRGQFVAQIAGVDWINDSKGTNVGATVAAIRGLVGASGELLLLIGGEAKNQSFAELGDLFDELGPNLIRAVILYGVDAELIASALPARIPQHRVAAPTDMDALVRIAQRLAQPGDTVLLSPACASFDMFANFEERGQRFIAAVERLREASDA